MLVKITAVLALSVLSSIAYADPFQYSFDFLGLVDGDGKHYADFNLTIDTPAQIEDTSFGPLPSPLPTTVGYPVNNFGENKLGDFGFSEEGGYIDSDGISIYFSSTTFVFLTSPRNTDFLGPGTYFGYTGGNNPFAFDGTGLLTVTDRATPEPSTFVLLGSGLLFAGAAFCRRLQSATASPAAVGYFKRRQS